MERIGDGELRSAAMLVVLSALMPFMIVIIPVVIMIVVTFTVASARLNDAGGCNHNQPQYEAAFDKGSGVGHKDAPVIAMNRA
jgi:hypothetical protein